MITFAIIVAVLAIMAATAGAIFLGFYLGRMGKDETPSMPSLPVSYEGEILDQSVYPFQTVDDN